MIDDRLNIDNEAVGSLFKINERVCPRAFSFLYFIAFQLSWLVGCFGFKGKYYL